MYYIFSITEDRNWIDYKNIIQSPFQKIKIHKIAAFYKKKNIC